MLNNYFSKLQQSCLNLTKAQLSGQNGCIEDWIMVGNYVKTISIQQLIPEISLENFSTINDQQFDLLRTYQQFEDSFYGSCSGFTSNSMKIFLNDYSGRGLRSTRKISQGDILLVEKSFLTGNYQIMCRMLELKLPFVSEETLVKYSQLQRSERVLKDRKPDLSERELVHSELLARLENNSFLMLPNLYLGFEATAKSSELLEGLFLNAALFNHSCAANCSRYFVGDIIVIVANRDIQADSELTLCYRSCINWDFAAFRSHTLQQYQFACQCEVCAKVTEEAKLKMRFLALSKLDAMDAVTEADRFLQPLNLTFLLGSLVRNLGVQQPKQQILLLEFLMKQRYGITIQGGVIEGEVTTPKRLDFVFFEDIFILAQCYKTTGINRDQVLVMWEVAFDRFVGAPGLFSKVLFQQIVLSQ